MKQTNVCNTFSNHSLSISIYPIQGEFVDDGTETHFDLKGHAAYIKAVSSGSRREGIIHTLILDGAEVPEAIEWRGKSFKTRRSDYKITQQQEKQQQQQ